jgi:chromosome segregation ATPase
MAERAKQKESLLELQEEEINSTEHLDSQVQKAHEQLLQLKRQQEQIEKQKRELEELSKRQEQLQQGKTEMTEKFTRALVVLERETYDAQKRVEQLRSMHESFAQHLGIIEAINPKNWDSADINKELNRALSAVDDARAEYAQSRSRINAESSQDVLEPAAPAAGDPYPGGYVEMGEKDFVYWLKSGFAFTLPLFALGVIILLVLLFRGS